jgi:RimJ/RimL family protein N-acetyltransferase
MTRVILTDGRRADIRVLGPSDAPALEAAVAHADPLDLRRRFMGSPPPASTLVRFLRKADNVHDLALGAFDMDGRLIGVAQFDRTDDAPSAEFAIEVAADWQRVGLGRRMLEELAEHARTLGITRLTATFYADNLAVRRLLHGSGLVVASGVDQGDGFAVLELDGSFASTKAVAAAG